MGWIDDIDNSIVYIDTAPIIYYIESNPNYTGQVDAFFASMQEGRFVAITSTVTLLEVLVRPTKLRDEKLIQRYQDTLLKSQQIDLINVDSSVAIEAARLRANHNLQVADSIQMATAIVSNARYFLTNDLRLPSLSNLTVLKLDELRTLPEYTEPNDNQ